MFNARTNVQGTKMAANTTYTISFTRPNGATHLAGAFATFFGVQVNAPIIICCSIIGADTIAYHSNGGVGSGMISFIGLYY